ncbi:hypothetical protein TrLO_g15563 [Triparma laevis f. longispina]|uniref:Uncharacterized protein n=1 Tax=Triparma laevis f. longispina TaxID=1714387 RepID=A0A9W7EB33_9STRA|nr:hypothetical protein TrLO_g15563 [Triparma laevis f. longispina]
MAAYAFTQPKEGQTGHGAPLFEVGELVSAQRQRNPLKKNFPALVLERRVVRGSTNQDDCTVCQVFYCLSCGLCCRSCAAASIFERYLYKVQYTDDRSKIDVDLEENYITKIVVGQVDNVPAAVATNI